MFEQSKLAWTRDSFLLNLQLWITSGFCQNSGRQFDRARSLCFRQGRCDIALLTENLLPGNECCVCAKICNCRHSAVPENCSAYKSLHVAGFGKKYGKCLEGLCVVSCSKRQAWMELLRVISLPVLETTNITMHLVTSWHWQLDFLSAYSHHFTPLLRSFSSHFVVVKCGGQRMCRLDRVKVERRSCFWSKNQNVMRLLRVEEWNPNTEATNRINHKH